MGWKYCLWSNSISGFLYLIAIMDWYSRFVLVWELSNTLDVYFCSETLKRALS